MQHKKRNRIEGIALSKSKYCFRKLCFSYCACCPSDPLLPLLLKPKWEWPSWAVIPGLLCQLQSAPARHWPETGQLKDRREGEDRVFPPSLPAYSFISSNSCFSTLALTLRTIMAPDSLGEPGLWALLIPASSLGSSGLGVIVTSYCCYSQFHILSSSITCVTNSLD